MKYPSGQTLPDNVYRALKFAGKTGFLNRRLWKKYFSSGNDRWHRRQIQSLLEKGFLNSHPNQTGNGCYVLTPMARFFLESRSLAHVSPAPIGQVCHDEVVADSFLSLERSKLVKHWWTEAELKSSRQFQLNEDMGNQKYPDAVFKVHAFGKERTMAIEYERTQKSSIRYKDILWLYSMNSNLGMILFVCEGAAIQNAINGQLKFINVMELWNRVAFTQAEDWRKSPADAPIKYGDKIITLRKICKKIEAHPVEKDGPPGSPERASHLI